jgi:ArsR family transcriptional regulator
MPTITDPDIRLLTALADPVRLSIVRQLSACDACCVCDLDACGDVSQPTVSHHLRILREAGLVRAERRGTWMWYSLEPAAVERLGSIARELVPAEPRRITGSRRPGRRGTRLTVLEAAPAAGPASTG